ICINRYIPISTKPDIRNIATALIGTPQNCYQSIRITALGYRVKLVDKSLIWLPNSAITNAVEVVDRRSIAHQSAKMPLGYHQE
ncbi:MAG TPA: hypothetical protein VH255_07515, partial [Verrucomicrobiae bacterium]|nr:hypothetical protein [Verrucomicrobiae bacterium]